MNRVLGALGGALALVCVLAAPASAQGTVAHVVVVGVPGLSWDDVSPTGTPELWDAASTGSIGALTVRAARSTTCVLDGWVTLGAGNRANFVNPTEPPEIPPEVPPGIPDDTVPAVPVTPAGCFGQETGVDLGSVLTALAGNADSNPGNSFGAEAGALGTAVTCATAVGRGPVLSVQTLGADVRALDVVPADPAGWAPVLEQCPISLIALGSLGAGAERGADLAGVDERLGVLRASLPPSTELIIAGISETGMDSSRLHVGIELGPAARSGFLTSASTGAAPYVQLIDIAPTALARLGLDTPPAMVGQAFQPGQDRAGSLEDAVAQLRDADVAARQQLGLTAPFFTQLVLIQVAACALGLLLLSRRVQRFAPAATMRHGAGWLRLGALFVSTLPVATFLANVVPWWRTGAPVPTLAALVLVIMTGLAAVAAGGPWRAHLLGPPIVVCAVTAVVLGVDVLTGARLELNSLLGYNPIVAGRFTGFGNLPFGVFGTAALLGTAAAMTGRPRRQARLVVLVAAVLTVVIDGAPAFGSDFGGVIALVPAFVVLTIVAMGARLTLLRLAGAGLAGVVVVVAIAVADYSRPADQQTHLGRFVGQLLDGSAGTIVHRKAAANVGLLVHSPLSVLVPVFGLTLWWLLRPAGLLRPLVVRHIELRAALWAVAIAGFIGFVVNDSGIAVPVLGGCLLVPLVLSVAAAVAADPGEPTPEQSGEGVTVDSREVAGPPD